MPRRVQDIVPNSRRSVRDIPVEKTSEEKPIKPTKKVADGIRKAEKEREIPINKTPKKEIPIQEETESKDQEVKEEIEEALAKRIPPTGPDEPWRMPVTPPEPPHRKKLGKRTTWLLVVIGIIVIMAGVAYLASSMYSRATFTIVAKSSNFKFDLPLVVQSTPTATNSLSYDIVSMRGTASTSVAAVVGPSISTKATGRVTVYNSYSAQAVRLIAGTRISNNSGKVYRLQNSILIPAYVSANKVISPGSIQTTVIADQAGQEYNISTTDSQSDFKVIAYKGSAKYDSIYARISGEFTGGWIGNKKTVDQSILATTTTYLKNSLGATLLKQIRSSVPEGYIMFDQFYTSTFSAPVQSSGTGNTMGISESGVVYGIMFKKSDLITKLAGDPALTDFGNFGYSEKGLEDIDATITNIKDFNPEKKGVLVVHFKGSIKLVGNVPVEELKKKFAGISLGDTQTVIKSYGAVVQTGSGELIPPWAHVPTNLNRISITVKEQ